MSRRGCRKPSSTCLDMYLLAMISMHASHVGRVCPGFIRLCHAVIFLCTPSSSCFSSSSPAATTPPPSLSPSWTTMSAPRPTMKTIQKRFYTVLPRAVSSTSAPASAISRVRSNSASSSRSLYTANSAYGPLAFFDSPPPPPPPPSSRPGNPHILSTSRLPVKAEGEGSSQSTSPHSHNSPHGQGQTSGQPPFSLALTSPQANSSSPPGLPISHQSAAFFPYSSFPPIPFCNVSLSDQSDSHPRVKRHRIRYHLDVGAYGIPKHAKKPVKPGMGSSGVSTGCFFQDVPAEDLNLAVQVGEDAYFIRENAMGVADGVGGWSRARGT